MNNDVHQVRVIQARWRDRVGGGKGPDAIGVNVDTCASTPGNGAVENPPALAIPLMIARSTAGFIAGNAADVMEITWCTKKMSLQRHAATT